MLNWLTVIYLSSISNKPGVCYSFLILYNGEELAASTLEISMTYVLAEIHQNK